METNYEVKGEEVLAVTVTLTFKEICERLKSTDGYRGSALIGMIQNQVAHDIAAEFLRKHTVDVLKMLDPKEIANMTALSVMSQLRGDRQ